MCSANAFASDAALRDCKNHTMDDLPYEIETAKLSPIQLAINVSDYTLKLFRDVDKLCGHRVIFRKSESVISSGIIAENSTSGTSSDKIPYQIEDFTVGATFDGLIPVIVYSGALGKIPDAVICHEVWHLLLAAQSGIFTSGYASPLYDHLIHKIQNEALLFNVFSHANTILHHTYIFYKMHQTGFRLKDSFERFTGSRNNYPPYDNNCSYYHIAIDVWHLMAGKTDGLPDISKALSQIETDYPESFELGRKMYSISKELRVPSDEPRIFKKILAELFQYRNKINFQKVSRGNTYNIGIYH